ncbi:restriction endonuclease subunit S [Comamonas sp.]|uniref:restriction endonuclease subunit S n=1 Tax=Comamonas sp. TaxID=34028 RepID=UPI00289C96E3|nr:restriction endonuclease subunit S [Comamonas sp.]
MSNLPTNWASCCLGDLVESISNGMPGTQNKEGVGIPVSRIETIANQQIDFSRIGYISQYDESKLDKFKLNVGDILFSHINSPVHIGKTAIFDSTKLLYHGINLLRIKVNSHICDYRYFNYACRLLRANGQFSLNAQHAVNQSSLNQTKISGFEIQLAPIREQRRIADKIDTTLARVDALNGRLARINPLLKRFRQSVLAAATSGKLTEDWRGSSEAENEWRSVSLKEVASDFSYGSSAKSSKSGRVPVLRMGNIQDGALDWTDLVYTSDPEEIKKYKLVKGDVLFNRTNSPELVGKTTIFQGEQEAIYAGYLIRVKCTEKLIPEYLNYCLGSPMGREYCWQVKSDGVSQSNINAKKLAAFEFLLPPIEEQTEIVRRVASLFAFADRLEARLQSAQTAAECLTPALLAKAFRGELVPQDPNDEPATELLRRLREARAAQAPTKPKRGRKAAAA